MLVNSARAARCLLAQRVRRPSRAPQPPRGLHPRPPLQTTSELILDRAFPEKGQLVKNKETRYIDDTYNGRSFNIAKSFYEVSDKFVGIVLQPI